MQPTSTGPRLIVIAGLPGSGKTTLAQQFENTRGAVRLCPDDWMSALAINVHDEAARDRVEALQWTVAQRLLSLGNTVIVEWGTWGKWERDRLRTEARALGAAVELHYLQAPLEELYRRIQLRGSEDTPIAWHDVQAWAALIEPPDAEEIALYDAPPLS